MHEESGIFSPLIAMGPEALPRTLTLHTLKKFHYIECELVQPNFYADAMIQIAMMKGEKKIVTLSLNICVFDFRILCLTINTCF